MILAAFTLGSWVETVPRPLDDANRYEKRVMAVEEGNTLIDKCAVNELDCRNCVPVGVVSFGAQMRRTLVLTCWKQKEQVFSHEICGLCF